MKWQLQHKIYWYWNLIWNHVLSNGIRLLYTYKYTSDFYHYDPTFHLQWNQSFITFSKTAYDISFSIEKSYIQLSLNSPSKINSLPWWTLWTIPFLLQACHFKVFAKTLSCCLESCEVAKASSRILNNQIQNYGKI